MIPEDRLILTGRSITITPALRTRVRTSLERALRRCPRLLEVHVLLSIEGRLRHICEVIVHLRSTTLACRASSEDLYTSIRAAAAKMERLAGRKRELQSLERRRASRKGRTRIILPEEDAGVRKARPIPRPEPVRPPERGEGGVVRIPPVVPPVLGIRDATAEVRRSTEGILVFLDSGSGNLQVLYRRPDGSLALIDTRVPPRRES